MKKILLVVILVIALLSLTACNKSLMDTTYKFDRCVISLPNGTTIEGKVDSWTDFEDGDQIQVKVNGVVYLTHSTNVVLISD